MKKLSFQIVNNIICEIYPFDHHEVHTYKSKISFDDLSKNLNLEWHYNFIKDHENSWNWEYLNQNKAVFKNITLGLLFPDKVELPPCTCFYNEQFCENIECAVNLDRLKSSNSLYKIFPQLFMKLDIMIQSGFIDSKMVGRFYKFENADELFSIPIPYK